MAERWMPIPGWRYYEASNLGRIKSLDRIAPMLSKYGTPMVRRHEGRILKQMVDQQGRHVVTLSECGVARRMLVHRAVLASFVGWHWDDEMEVAHWDGNPANNRLNNLRWATRRENIADKLRHGTMSIGEKSHYAKLTAADVRQIRGPLRHITCEKLASKFNVSKSCIHLVRRERTWVHVQ